MPEEMFPSLAQFGVAGLMGALWVWERLYSRRRERQLSEVHEVILNERQQLQVLVELVRNNTASIERFDRTQTQLVNILERAQHDKHHHAA